jgi:hypothetical protein
LEEDQGRESDGQPDPADLHKIEIEDVVLPREVVDWAFGEVEVCGEGGS